MDKTIEEQIQQRMEGYTMGRVLQKANETSLSVIIPNIYTNYLGWEYRDNVVFSLKGDTIVMRKVKK